MIRASRYSQPHCSAAHARRGTKMLSRQIEASNTTASRWMISDIDFHQYRMRYCAMLVSARSVVLIVGVGASLLIVGGVSGAQQAPAAPAAASGSGGQ